MAGRLRRYLQYAGTLLLVLGVVTLSTESRLRFDADQCHLSKHYKLTGTADGAVAVPVPLHAGMVPVVLEPHGIAPVLAGVRWEPASFSRSHLLRAPPLSTL
jgi:hypothetical protein